MGPTWGRQDPDGPHVGPMNLAIWDLVSCSTILTEHAHYPIYTIINSVYVYLRMIDSHKTVLDVISINTKTKLSELEII